ncbi:hypothetical protein Tco_0698943 [Tanacetum coccineum]
MYGIAIKFVTNKNAHQSAASRLKAYPTYSFSSDSTHHNKKDSNFVNDIRKSASGLPPVSSSGDNRVNAVKTTTTPLSDDNVNVVNTSTSPSTSAPSSAYDRLKDDHDSSSFAADAAKQGVRKAMETGLDIGEMAKNTLDSVYNATKDTTHMVKEAVTGDDRKNNDVPPTDRFVDDLRKHADGYDLKNKYK